ncbi:TIGR03943 family putative permease subunit [Schumannella soli]|uniref:TIGR03943 family protein n=1 Tax=Schumannella soli TaxID=2590779 RepID=A0A506Y175_9MICO|nr:TIGR03943 family protein [Schumannella soli]TPW75643.1 TIGR03943 family protein [Schumannella soli]
MRADRLVARWIGPLLALVAVVATLWLAATGKLALYIHPRYTVFAVVMAVIGGVAVLAGSFFLLRKDAKDARAAVHDHADHDHADHADHSDAAHDHDHDEIGPGLLARPRLLRSLTVGRVLIIAGALVALLILPPAALTSATAQNRALATSADALQAPAANLVGTDTSKFTVKDWASLLRSGGESAVAGQTVQISGYLLDNGDADVVYVARLMVTCCAVDAQPVGVPVYLPDWKKDHKANSWVKLTGRFQQNPSGSGAVPVVIVPSEFAGISEPDQPYVY